MSRQRLAGAPLGTASRAAAAALLVALVTSLNACGGDGDTTTTTATAPPPPAATVTVYFSDDAGELVAEERPAPPGPALDAAMEALAQGPADPSLVPALPPGTRLLGAGVADDVATVDLSPEFESGYPSGGSAAELAVLGPLVRTAAEAAGAGRVRILVEGRAPAPPDSQFDLSQPLAPADVAAAG
jgi:spore germination protein GerM